MRPSDNAAGAVVKLPARLLWSNHYAAGGTLRADHYLAVTRLTLD